MAGPDGKMDESGGIWCGREIRTEFCLEITEEKDGSRGDEFDDPGHVHSPRREKLISLT
jgi:hypothetical protein